MSMLHRDLCTKQKQEFESTPAQIADCIIILPKQCLQLESANSPFPLEQQQMNPVADIFEAFTCLPDIKVVTQHAAKTLPSCAVEHSRIKCTAKFHEKRCFAKQEASLTAEQ